MGTEITIPTNADYYGSAATDAEALAVAEAIAEHVTARYPAVQMRLVPECQSFGNQSSGPLADEIERWVDENWVDWAAAAVAADDTRQCDACYERFPQADLVQADWGWACPACAKLGEPPVADDPEEN